MILGHCITQSLICYFSVNSFTLVYQSNNKSFLMFGSPTAQQHLVGHWGKQAVGVDGHLA